MTQEPLPLDLDAEAFFAADHAVVENGKMYINGGYWTQVNHPEYPAIQNFSLAVILRIPWRAYGQNHRFAVTFEDADGHNVGPQLDGQFLAARPLGLRAGTAEVAPFAIHVHGFVIPRAGEYAAVLQVDQTEIRRWTFRALQVFDVPASPPGGSGPGGVGGTASE